MPKNPSLKNILVIGSGPIIIGQGCEFDYSGTQSTKALREEGCRVILLNSNPATVMTDSTMADATYIAPMTLETCNEIIKKEKIDAVLSTVGGQTALNLSLELAQSGILSAAGIELIGASAQAIEKAENRKLFREIMHNIGLETPAAHSITNIEEIFSLKESIVFPLIVRTSFTLGGFGSGIVNNLEELINVCQQLFSIPSINSVELEESLIGWKEFEMEAIRDRADNCIIVCSIENVDPMGVHTGDSITIAPAQTLCNKEYQRMRSATFEILRAIGVDTGGANVQFAVNPQNGRMLVIEMNPRVSRSSALASKATGYPIAKVATKLALGYTLDELSHALTGNHIPASFEPSIDYVVTKIPRFDFEKFPKCDGVLTTKMQSIGETMGVGRNFLESFQKALAGVENNFSIFALTDHSLEYIIERISKPYHDRILYVIEGLRRGLDLNYVHEKTLIDKWILEQINLLAIMHNDISKIKFHDFTKNDFTLLKQNGFSDKYLAEIFNINENEIRDRRKQLNILPIYKRIDSCAAEFLTNTACLYSSYDTECEARPSSLQKIMIIGSGPNRIGQGLEFDYTCVFAALASREAGFETIMINNNPETVSTDYDIVDRLYFEPLTLEHVLNVVEIEKPDSVILQFGGQTAIKLVPGLNEAKVPILGTSAASIDCCENRDSFQKLVKKLNLRQPDNFCIYHSEDYKTYANNIQYPVIIRPSYLLSGSSMKILRNAIEFISCLDLLSGQQKYFPILVEKFLENAIEIEVDGICDGKDVFIPGIMEQADLAGVHSGDSTCFIPARSLSPAIQHEIIEQATQLALAIGIVGFFNVQFAIQNEDIFIIEVNPRSSRTIPFLSKALSIPLPKIAMKCLLGETLQSQGYVQPIKINYYSVKIPIFPFDRLGQYELSPEMRSTGEIMLINKNFTENFQHDFDIISLQEVAKYNIA